MPGAVLLNPSDPLYYFENMMQHRQYMAVMPDLFSFSTVPYLLDPASDPNSPADPWNLNHQQAHNDFNSVLPANYNDGYTLTAVHPAAASGTATSTGTTDLTIAGSTGQIIIGATITVGGVTATIVAQQSGTPGGDGIYTTNIPTTWSSQPITIDNKPYQQANPLPQDFGIQQAGIILQGSSDPLTAFYNQMQHMIANNAALPLPTTSATTAGTGPGVADVSDPWWWVSRSPILYPYW